MGGYVPNGGARLGQAAAGVESAPQSSCGRGRGGRCGILWSPLFGYPEAGPSAPRPGLTLWSSMAAAQLVPARPAGPARSSRPQAGGAAAGSQWPAEPSPRCRAPLQRSITGHNAQARPPPNAAGWEM